MLEAISGGREKELPVKMRRVLFRDRKKNFAEV